MTQFPQIIIGSLIFAAELGLFLFSVTKAITLGTKGMTEAMTNMEQFADLIIFSAGVLLLCSAIYMIPGFWKSALGFVLELTFFVGANLAIFAYLGKMIDTAIDNAEKFAVLIGITAASLMLGGFLFMVYPWMMATVLLFGVELTAFVALVTGAYVIASMYMGPQQIQFAEQFSLLVAISAASLLIGGYAMMKNPWLALSCLVFGVELALFVAMITAVYVAASKFGSKPMQIAKEFGIVVAISAATLLIGGAVMMIRGMKESVGLFALTLGLFVIGTVGIFAYAGKQLENSIRPAITLAVITALTGAALLLAGWLILENPGLDVAILKFGALTTGYLLAMTAIMKMLSSKNLASTAGAVIALAGITAVTYGMGQAIKVFAEVSNETNDLGRLIAIVGIAFGVIASLAGAVAGIVALTTGTAGIGAAAIGIAEGLLAGLVGIAWMMGKAIQSIVTGLNMANNMKNIDVAPFGDAIKGIIGVVQMLYPLSDIKSFIKVKIACSNVNSMARAISNIGFAVKDIADLAITEYDENGRKIGKRHLKPEDFDNAASNIAIIITTLGDAIIDTYDKNPGIFTTGSTLADLLGFDTPFARVVKSCTLMGKMISLIADGVKDYASFTVPMFDKNGNKIGKRVLTNDDFSSAAENVKTIISVLGGAIMELYNGKIYDSKGNVVAEAKEMFGWRLIGDNPFVMVVNSCSTMGSMLSKISKGIKDYAELRMPIYNEKGQITGYREMTEDDFVNASNNIGIILSTLGSSIISAYNSNPEMFTDPSTWHTDADKTPFGMVVKAMAGTGDLILSGAKAIDEVNKLQLPDLTKIKTKIGQVVSIMCESIMSVYKDPEKTSWFEDDSWWHSDPTKTPFGMVKACLSGVGEMIIQMSKSIQEVNNLPIKYSDVAANGQLYNKIKNMVNCIPAAIMSAALDEDGDIKEIFEDDEIYSSIKEAYKYYTDTLNIIAKSYKDIINLNLSDKKGEENSIYTITTLIGTMVKSLPEKIIAEYNAHKEYYDGSNNDKLENIKTAFENYKSVISNIAKSYKTLYDCLNSIGAVENDTAIDNINTSFVKMMNNVGTIVTISNSGIMSEEVMKNFVTSAKLYRNAISNILKTYNDVPDDDSKFKILENAISNVNIRVTQIPSLEMFEKETTDLSMFVKTLNSLDSFKVGKFTELVDAINSLGNKFNGLDRFTDAMTNKMAKVLQYLADQISQSAKTINKADEIQKKRHEHIQKLINEMRELMNMGLDITIKEANSESYTPSASSGSASGNYSGGSSYSDNYEVSKSSGKENASTRNSGGIDYNRLRETIKSAILATKPISPKR